MESVPPLQIGHPIADSGLVVVPSILRVGGALCREAPHHLCVNHVESVLGEFPAVELGLSSCSRVVLFAGCYQWLLKRLTALNLMLVARATLDKSWVLAAVDQAQCSLVPVGDHVVSHLVQTLSVDLAY